MKIKMNSNESYLGKDIRNWCAENLCKGSLWAVCIYNTYWSPEVEYHPNDNVYYFMKDGKLIRDTIKLPRKTDNRRK